MGYDLGYSRPNSIGTNPIFIPPLSSSISIEVVEVVQSPHQQYSGASQGIGSLDGIWDQG